LSVTAAIESGLSRVIEDKEKKRNFTQSIELVINIKDVDLTKPEKRFSMVVELPRGLAGKARRIAVIASGNLALEAQRSGSVDKVFERAEIEAIIGNKREAKKIAERFDYILVEPALLPIAAKALGAALGSRGKAPIPIPPGSSIDELASKYKRSVTLMLRKVPQISAIIGTEEMSHGELLDNVQAVINRVLEKLEKRWGNIGSIYLKKSMGPPIKVEMPKKT